MKVFMCKELELELALELQGEEQVLFSMADVERRAR